MRIVETRKYDKQLLNKNLTLIIALGLIVVLGAVLRFHDLDTESYGYDELIMVHVTKGNLELNQIKWLLSSGTRPPLLVFLGHLWVKAFGTTETATRMLSALAGVAAIAVMYAVGRELFGKRIGLIGALLLAISPFQIFFAQDYRYYSLLVLMTLLSFYFYIRALKGRQLRHFILYVLFSTLTFYTHAYGAFILTAQGLYFLLQWNRYPKARALWLLSQLAIILALTPYLSGALTRALASSEPTLAASFGLMQPGGSQPLWLLVHNLFILYLLSGDVYLGWMRLLTGPTIPQSLEISMLKSTLNSDYLLAGLAIAALAFLVIGILLFAMWKGKAQWSALIRGLATDVQDYENRKSELLLVVFWWLFPVVLPFILVKPIGFIYLPRYTASASPAYYLLLALVIVTVRKILPEFISLGLFIIVFVPGLHHYYVTDVKDQWRETAAYVEEQAREGDVLIFVQRNNESVAAIQNAFFWYFSGNLPACGLNTYHLSSDEVMDALIKCGSGAKRIWLITRDKDPEEKTEFSSFYSNHNPEPMHLIQEQKFLKTAVYLFGSGQGAVSEF